MYNPVLPGHGKRTISGEYMKYISTRGGIAPISFKKAVMMGLATDGGLLLPQTMPRIDEKTVAAWRRLSYPELSHAVLSLFIDDIPADDLRELINRSYADLQPSGGHAAGPEGQGAYS